MSKATICTGKPPGVISNGSIYTLSEFKARTGIKDWALRTARRAGMRVCYIGNCVFICGDDFVEYAKAKQIRH